MWVVILILALIALSIMSANPAPNTEEEAKAIQEGGCLKALGPVFLFWVVVVLLTALYFNELGGMFFK